MNDPLPRGRYLRARPEIFEELDREAERLSVIFNMRYTWADVARGLISRYLEALLPEDPPKPSKPSKAKREEPDRTEARRRAAFAGMKQAIAKADRLFPKPSKAKPSKAKPSKPSKK